MTPSARSPRVSARPCDGATTARRGEPRKRRHPAQPQRSGEAWSQLLFVDPIAFALFGIPPFDATTPGPPRYRPARHRHRHEPHTERYYVGRRSSEAQPQVFLVGAHVERLRHRHFRSGARFDWGTRGPGADELAFAILNHAITDAPTEPMCRQFTDEVLASLDPDGFVLSTGEVLLWAVAAIADVTMPAHRPTSRRGHALARAVARVRGRLGRHDGAQ